MWFSKLITDLLGAIHKWGHLFSPDFVRPLPNVSNCQQFNDPPQLVRCHLLKPPFLSGYFLYGQSPLLLLHMYVSTCEFWLDLNMNSHNATRIWNLYNITYWRLSILFVCLKILSFFKFIPLLQIYHKFMILSTQSWIYESRIFFISWYYSHLWKK